jgi:hypothetical protein
VAEFAGHRDGTPEETATRHERTTYAVAEVEKHKGVGSVGCGLVAERERLDLLNGAYFGAEQASDLGQETGGFDDREVGRAQDAGGGGVENTGHADDDEATGLELELAACGIDPREERGGGSGCCELGVPGRAIAGEGLRHDGGAANPEFDDRDLPG